MNFRSTGLGSLLACVTFISGCEKAPHTTPVAPVVVAPVATVAAVAAKEQFVMGSETAQSMAALKTIGSCSLENILTMPDGSTNSSAKNSYSVAKGAAYKLIGFATDVEKGAVPKAVRMVLVGAQSYRKDFVAGLERPDVATYFKIPALGIAGYQLDVGFDHVAPGEYAVFILDLDGVDPLACPTHQTITIK